jgi:hypothetical protein
MLSVIVTTSPIPSNPSLEMIEKVIDSILQFPVKVQIYVVFDGVRNAAPGKEEEFKSGKISQDSELRYKEFRINFIETFGSPSNSEEEFQFDFSVGKNTVSHVTLQRISEKISIVTHSIRIGFALAVSSALQNCKTEVVMIHQHDWILTQDCVSKLNEFCNVILNGTYNYLTFVSRRSKNYIKSNHPILVKRHFETGESIFTIDDNPFCRLFYWYDRPHLARTSFYLTKVFSLGRFKRGDFTEDTFGHDVMQSSKDYPLLSEKGWAKYRCIMYYPDDGDVIGAIHLNGRHYKTIDGFSHRDAIL